MIEDLRKYFDKNYEEEETNPKDASGRFASFHSHTSAIQKINTIQFPKNLYN